MRRLLKFFAAATMSLLMAANFALAEGIQNSKHDFSAATWSDKEICKPCHTPHNALDTSLTGRLWAHTLSTQTYVYHGGSLTNDGSTRPEAGTGSAACASHGLGGMHQKARVRRERGEGEPAIADDLGRQAHEIAEQGA